nr:transposase [Streptomyces sp. PR69]
MDVDRRQVTCPRGETSAGWHGPYPTSSPTAAPLIVARFTKSQCRPCPVRTRCTTTTDSARTVGSPRCVFFAVLQEGRWPPGPA